MQNEEKKLIEMVVRLKEESSKLPPLAEEEQRMIEAENDFESVYFSNKLEGNKLSEEEAKNAILGGSS